MINPAILFKGNTIAVDLVAKYVYSQSETITTSAASIIAGYNIAYTDVTNINNYFGVGTAGIATVEISYTRNGAYLREVIYADKTSSTSFWTDITGWIYANNFYGITFDSGTNKYIINDSGNHTYYHIK